MENKHVAQAQGIIQPAERIVITCHKSPDGDAIGSSMALYHYFREKGKEVNVVVPDDYPKFLKWMTAGEEVLVADKDLSRAEAIFEQADLIFTLDYNALNRAGVLEKALASSEAKKIMIDHHQDPEAYADITISDTESCSTAQMVFEFIEKSGDIDCISEAAGKCIYCGIMTDSGSFRFPSVTPYTHRVAAHLMELGVDHAAVHQAIHDANSPDKMRLVGYAISEKMELFPELHAGIISLNQAELKKYHYQSGDTEGLVNQVLSIEGINFAVFVREAEDKVKMSFRSIGDFKVNEFAGAHFNGGGHNNAAGGASDEPIEDVLTRLRSLIKKESTALAY